MPAWYSSGLLKVAVPTSVMRFISLRAARRWQPGGRPQEEAVLRLGPLLATQIPAPDAIVLRRNMVRPSSAVTRNLQSRLPDCPVWVLCHEHRAVCRAERNCPRDEGGPFGLGNQVRIPSRRKLLRSKAVAVSVAETPGRDSGRQGRERRAQANRYRSVESGLGDVRTGG